MSALSVGPFISRTKWHYRCLYGEPRIVTRTNLNKQQVFAFDLYKAGVNLVYNMPIGRYLIDIFIPINHHALIAVEHDGPEHRKNIVKDRLREAKIRTLLPYPKFDLRILRVEHGMEDAFMCNHLDTILRLQRNYEFEPYWFCPTGWCGEYKNKDKVLKRMARLGAS